jgi:hypothetical protein
MKAFNIIDVMDDALLLFYRQTRRAVHFLAALVPLVLLLVGSCKTSQIESAFASPVGAHQVRAALFPDRPHGRAAAYHPAEGYISRARQFISHEPRALVLLTEEEVGYLFGSPQMTRKDKDSEVWQYKTDTCVVDFYFYGSSKTAPRDVTYADVRSKKFSRTADLPKKAQSKCLRAIIDGSDI